MNYILVVLDWLLLYRWLLLAIPICCWPFQFWGLFVWFCTFGSNCLLIFCCDI